MPLPAHGSLPLALPSLRHQTDVNPFTLKLALELQAEAKLEHWRLSETENFSRGERKLRNLNRNAARLQYGGGDVADDLFLSHCWRQPSTQEVARKCISYLSRVKSNGTRGFTYYADFLDLAAVGPVAWRREIHDAVRGTAKFVALIDEAYLSSFNCIQELYFAMWESKPIVPIILDNRAWNILTSPRASEDLWNTDQEFQDHEGVPLVDDIVFDQHALREVLGCVSNINMCPCRPTDFDVMGDDTCLNNMLAYVARDLPYLKEHTKLGNRARLWSAGNRPLTAAALLVGEDIAKWSAWLDQAIKYQQHPLPTDLQKDYCIKTSKRYSYRRLRMLTATGAFLVFLIICAFARRQASLAQKNIQAAMREADTSRMLSKDAIISSTLSALGREPGVTKLWELKALNALLQQLSPDDLQDSIYIAMVLVVARKLMSRPVATGEAVLKRAMPNDSGLRALRWSPSGQWLAAGSPCGIVHLFPMLPDGLLRESMTLEGHAKEITSVAWSPSEQLLASASGDHTVRVWSFPHEDGHPQNVLANHTDVVTYVAWSSSGQQLASACQDGIVRVWNVSDDHEIEPQSFQQLSGGHSGPVTRLAWSPSGRWLASGGDDGTVALWAVAASGGSTASLNSVLADHSKAVTALLWLPLGGFTGDQRDANGTQVDVLVSSGEDEAVLASPVPASGSPWKEPVLLDHGGVVVRDMAWSPSGLATACGDGSIRIWPPDVENPQPSGPRYSLDGAGHFREVSAVTWSPSGKYLASGTLASALRVWGMHMSVLSGSELSGVTAYREAPLHKVSWSPSGDRLAIGLRGGGLYVQPILTDGQFSEDQAVLTRFPVPDELPFAGRMTWAKSLPMDMDWSPSGRQLALSGVMDVTLWDMPPGLPVPEAPSQVLRVEKFSFVSRWSPTGQHLAASSDTVVRIWGVGPDGTVADTAGVALEGHTGTITTGSWSPDGRYFATSGQDNTARVWVANPATNGFLPQAMQVIATNHTAGVAALEWSPDGRQLATGGCDNKVRVWWVSEDGSVSSSTGVQELDGPAGCITHLAWSSSGRHIAAAATDNSVYVWTVEGNGYVVRDLRAVQVLRRSNEEAHAPSSSDLAWSPNEQLVSVGPVGGLKMWGAFTIEQVLLHFDTAECFSNVHWGLTMQELSENGLVPSMLVLPRPLNGQVGQ
eukprot:CAMPEP_0117653646 /NCGR_PEP_ID=MMETSP0804-20121206/3308_1 /TAXON_ID=1074897 /ORGANISM="Tetraselmis astigmatica, Strain CCMP880" /LENGTH=1168 /DNA_ID=CAMNT_0005459847 /DNA_START=42 /DNA_END=3548 /DNA_ORIENTATION=-